jgi:hypothetical protein
MEKQLTQTEADIAYLLQHDQYLRVLKALEHRRESVIQQFSVGLSTDAALHQMAGEMRAVNEMMAALGYFSAKQDMRFKQL